MNAYLIGLTILFAFTSGNSLAIWWVTREWFFRWSAPVMGLSALVTGTLAAWTA